MSQKRRRLTPKQELFCVEYLRDRNATRAAIAAGYSEKTAYAQGSRLLRNVEVRRRVDARTEATYEEVKIDIQELIRDLNRIRKFDPRKLYDKAGNRIPIHELPDDVALALESIKVFEEFEGKGENRMKVGETRDVTAYSKTEAIRMLGQHLGMFKHKVEHTVDDDLAAVLDKARERAKGSRAGDAPQS